MRTVDDTGISDDTVHLFVVIEPKLPDFLAHFLGFLLKSICLNHLFLHSLTIIK